MSFLRFTATYRAIGRSENPGVPVVIRWAYSVSLVEIGLTDLPKSGGGHGTPGTPRDDTPDIALCMTSHIVLK